MVAYSFKGRFEPAIRAKRKRHTIRAIGKKRHARPGERMTMTTGDRFHPRQMGSGICEAVQPITINFEKTTKSGRRLAAHIVIGSPDDGATVIRTPDLDDFARRDGFEDWKDLCAFWRTTHGDLDAFTGLLILWGDSFEPTP
ncbi:hypothetical protein [uncultured Brevundimonas sp.]|uniref:hypothetical protein n=1 Tax=uncultured Brevundimonas sp. TaxID=213418 RepID=UPI0025F70486|nr:hypothetical protein [uncultured Brevundimonas sp.]